MLYAGGLLGAVLLLLWLFCIIDVIMTPDGECRHLPKLLWLGIVVLLSSIGSIAWLLAGRPWPGGSPIERPRQLRVHRRASTGNNERSAPAYPEYDRPGRFAATNPDDADAFLAQVRERAEAQRRSQAARRREQDKAEHEQRAERERQRAREDAGKDVGEDPGGHDPSPPASES